MINGLLPKQLFLSAIIFGLLLFSGCDNPAKTSLDQASSIKTPDCLLCGEWETPMDVGFSWHLLLSPDQIELSSHSVSGLECTIVSQNLEIIGEYKGLILLNDSIIYCNDNDTQNIKKFQIEYLLRKYTLLLNIDNQRKALFVRSGVKIPEQKNPLFGKWMPFKRGKRSEDYKDLWETASTRVWFKKDRSISIMETRHVQQYIVEDDRVVVVYKNGEWLIAEISNHNAILINSSQIK